MVTGSLITGSVSNRHYSQLVSSINAYNTASTALYCTALQVKISNTEVQSKIPLIKSAVIARFYSIMIIIDN